jgi:hypothetical protein
MPMPVASKAGMKIKVFRPERREPPPAGGVLISEWPVGKRTVRLVQDVNVVSGSCSGYGTLRCEWIPNLPRRLGKREWREYRAGRDHHHQQLANILGSAVVLAEP